MTAKSREQKALPYRSIRLGDMPSLEVLQGDMPEEERKALIAALGIDVQLLVTIIAECAQMAAVNDAAVSDAALVAPMAGKVKEK